MYTIFYTKATQKDIPRLETGALEKPHETPNADTLEAMAELDSGGGYKFSGTTEQLFAELTE